MVVAIEHFKDVTSFALLQTCIQSSSHGGWPAAWGLGTAVGGLAPDQFAALPLDDVAKLRGRDPQPAQHVVVHHHTAMKLSSTCSLPSGTAIDLGANKFRRTSHLIHAWCKAGVVVGHGAVGQDDGTPCAILMNCTPFEVLGQGSG